MCKDTTSKKGDYLGSNPKDGEAHYNDHNVWSRRQFLLTGGLAGVGSFTLGATPISSFMPNPLMAALDNCETDRVIVLLRLFGGNDGLNMIIPHTAEAGRAKYEEYRPTLALKQGTDYNGNHVLSGFGPANYAMQESMEKLMPIWQNGKMAVVQNVGYPDQNFSHFTSSNLWATAADDKNDSRYNSGWMGRSLNQDFPAFSETPPTVPPALQIGFTNNLIFKNEGGDAMELVFRNPDEFYRLAQEGKLYSNTGLGDCSRDLERGFLRQTANNSLRYSETVVNAYNKSETKATFPTGTNNQIAEQLSIVSRLIKGELGTKVFMVYINGFDTHANQANAHRNLMQSMSDSIGAFFEDLEIDGYDKDVLLMTFSEFGRTIVENGSVGTDHGNLSPLMLFGPGVEGGFYGNPIDLSDPGIPRSKRIYFENQSSLDYRGLYATIFEDWLGVDGEVVSYLMGAEYNKVSGLIKDPCAASVGSNGVGLLLGHNTTARGASTYEIKYAVSQASNIKLQVFDPSGQKMAVLDQGYKLKGNYTVHFDPVTHNLSPGTYIYRIDSAGRSYSRKLSVQ